jgi:hypothetical protein
MAKMVLTATYVAINSVDWSDWVSKCTLEVDVKDVDATTFGSEGWSEVLGGLKSAKFDLTFKQDIAPSGLDDTMWPLLGTLVPFEVRLTNAPVGTGNPKYTGNALVAQWIPVSGSPGDIAEVQVSWIPSGAVARATA